MARGIGGSRWAAAFREYRSVGLLSPLARGVGSVRRPVQQPLERRRPEVRDEGQLFGPILDRPGNRRGRDSDDADYSAVNDQRGARPRHDFVLLAFRLAALPDAAPPAATGSDWLGLGCECAVCRPLEPAGA